VAVGRQFGYFALRARSLPGCRACASVLSSATFFALSPDTNPVAADRGDRNRKVLAQSKRERQTRKMRRRARMLAVSKYIKESGDAAGNLTGGAPRLSEALNETREMVVRAQQCVSAENLSVFIRTKLKPTLAKAEARYARVADAAWAMKSEMVGLWDDVKRDLRGMSAEIRQGCFDLQGEAAEAAEEIRGRLLPQSLSVERAEVGTVERALFVVASAELCAFVLFCVRYHCRNWRRKRK
jgi:hypothetical protein